jgi:uncharacterized membrane protein YkoI
MKKWWIAVILALLVAGSAIGITVAVASGGSSQEQAEEQEAQSLSSQAKITAEQAKEAALAANPDATITQVELDNENGTLVWGVELADGTEVKVDAGSGQIRYTEQSEENDNDEVEYEDQDGNDALEENEAGAVPASQSK